MRLAGYNEGYRKQVLKHAITIYDKMKEENAAGTTPLNRPSTWQSEQRRENKKTKRNSWSNKGGHIAPIFVPPTPKGELAAQLRQIAEQETEAGVKFRIVETGGRTVKSIVQSSNPTATKGCEEQDCLACQAGRGEGGNCRQSNICYEIECRLCPEDKKSLYIGESSQNLYARTKEHVSNYRKQTQTSFMHKHQIKKHDGLPGRYSAKVTGSYKDCLSRQVSEGVSIRRSTAEVLNSKSEWHQPPLWQVQNELVRR